jgi:hypothetical protein
MRTTQKALIVKTGPEGHEGLEELNIELERGWRVAEVAPMGGAGGASASPGHAALVILEGRDLNEPQPAVAAKDIEDVEEEADEVVEEVVEEVDEVVEGDGANPEEANPEKAEPEDGGRTSSSPSPDAA